jgi:hypothetical protein
VSERERARARASLALPRDPSLIPLATPYSQPAAPRQNSPPSLSRCALLSVGHSPARSFHPLQCHPILHRRQRCLISLRLVPSLLLKGLCSNFNADIYSRRRNILNIVSAAAVQCAAAGVCFIFARREYPLHTSSRSYPFITYTPCPGTVREAERELSLWK